MIWLLSGVFVVAVGAGPRVAVGPTAVGSSRIHAIGGWLETLGEGGALVVAVAVAVGIPGLIWLLSGVFVVAVGAGPGVAVGPAAVGSGCVDTIGGGNFTLGDWRALVIAVVVAVGIPDLTGELEGISVVAVSGGVYFPSIDAVAIVVAVDAIWTIAVIIPIGVFRAYCA